MIKEDSRLLTDEFVKSTDQYLYAPQLPVMYTTLKNPCRTVTLCVLTRSASKTIFFDKKCNDVEVWLKPRSYNEKLVGQQILKAWKYRRTEPLYSQGEEVHKNKLVFNITYYPIFSKLKNILSKNSSSFITR